VPDHPTLLALLEIHGSPLLATTLIPKDETQALNDADLIRQRYEHQVAAVIDAGACSLQATTVVDLTGMSEGGEPEVLRQGLGKLELLGL
jgi:tRNA A37 threonylcarbamoyladenosine synthetase subunit TsaC/SUA5/YrdC